MVRHDTDHDVFFVITQFTAAVGAFLFGSFRTGGKPNRHLFWTLLIWVIAAMLIYESERRHRFREQPARIDGRVFEGGACVSCRIDCRTGSGIHTVCLPCHGRTVFSGYQVREFFGLWSFTSRLSAIFGLMGWGCCRRLPAGGGACLFGIVSDGHGHCFLCR